MGLFPQQFLEDLKMQANILTVIQEYVPLKRAGASYEGVGLSDCIRTGEAAGRRLVEALAGR